MNQKKTAGLHGFVSLLFVFSISQFTGFGQTWTPRQASVAASDGYYEYLPQGYNDPANNTKKYPLLVFAHGIGETGNGTTDLAKLNNTGLPWLINQGKFPASFNVGGNNYSFIVICPQFKWWPGSTDMEAVMAYAMKNYRVDSARVYMTGLSMGGGVTWDYASASTTNANILAAILPIAGAATATTQKCQNMAGANLPVWATHNDNDPTVSVWNTLNFISGINAFNPTPPAQKTIFSSYAHDAWTQTYDPAYKLDGKHNCYEWMLQYSRGSAPTPAPPPPPPTPPIQALSASIINTKNVGCNGQSDGSATVQVTGGVIPYNYSWNTTPAQTGATATNLSAGNYTVTVKDAAGTVVTSAVAIIQPAPLELLLMPGTIRLMGGTTTVGVDARGGVGPYSFTGPTLNVAAGTYVYNVLDANKCGSSAKLELKDPGVQLTGFTLNVADTLIGLQWSTGYEYAIDHFELEKSFDGQLYQPDGMVVSHGNSMGTTEYRTGDVNTRSGRNYYRLYVVTQYGERKLLAEKSLYYEDHGQVTIRNLADRIDITVTSSKNEKVFLQLIDMNGRTLQSLQLNKENAGLRTSLSLNGLPRGMYVVKVFTSTVQTAKQVVKP